MHIVGPGKMGKALAKGLFAAGQDVTLVCVNEEQADQVARLVPQEIATSSSLPHVPDQDIVVAVKPDDVYSVLCTIVHPSRVISIAAGVTISSIEYNLPVGSKVLRAMPNLPVVIGAGVTGVAASKTCAASDLDWARGVFSSVGEVVEVEESQLDLVTGISGSGPGYFYRIVAGLQKAAIEHGLSPEQAEKLVKNTFFGAAKQYFEQPESAAELVAEVATAGGTTEAGLNQLELAEIDAILSKVVSAASRRSSEIGKAEI